MLMCHVLQVKVKSLVSCGYNESLQGNTSLIVPFFSKTICCLLMLTKKKLIIINASDSMVARLMLTRYQCLIRELLH